MCGRYASFLPAEALARIFGTVNPLPNFECTWNMAPTREAPVVRLARDGQRHLDALKWGLLPYFAKDLKKARKPINARSETVTTSRMFREAFIKRRCLVPAPIYYEGSDDLKGKTPFAVARVDGEPVAFAGIWEEWPLGADPGPHAGHHRTDWLAGLAWRSRWRPCGAAALLRPAPEGVLRFWPVDKKVGVARHGWWPVRDRQMAGRCA